MNSKESLARKIAELISSDEEPVELSSILSRLDAMDARLAKLEAPAPRQSPAGSQVVNAVHPSQERFAIAEAIADAVFVGVGKEKACTFEPNAKPCDHCSMCSSRGF